MLGVLTRRDITDTVAVVTRYFGGAKLGGGGLIRAYGRSVTEALDAVGTVRRASHISVDVSIEHAEAGRLENELRGAGYRIAAIDYANEVRMTLHIPSEEHDRFGRWLAERTGGRAAARFGPELFIDLPDE